MKRFILLLTILSLPALGFAQKNKDAAQKNKNCIEAAVIADDIKMYRQAGTSSEVLTNLKTTDEVLFHRKLNSSWAVVTVGDQAGYVLYSELTNRKTSQLANGKSKAEQAPAVAMQKKRK